MLPGAAGTDTAGTLPYSINGAGAIAGFYSDVSAVNHGFVRDPGGNISAIDAPGAGTLAGQRTIARSINALGAIAGEYTDVNNANHGFVRHPSGHFTTFDAPGAVFGTFVYGINAVGTVTGHYSDVNGLPHAFTRTSAWKFSEPKDPSYGSAPTTINDSGRDYGSTLRPLREQAAPRADHPDGSAPASHCAQRQTLLFAVVVRMASRASHARTLRTDHQWATGSTGAGCPVR